MIQAVADDEERGSLGMHYTSVPNILKVLNPLFLDDLRAQLEAAGDNVRKLLNLRKRMSTNPRVRSGVRLRQFPRHRLQGNAGDRGRDRKRPTGSRRSLDPAREFPRHRD